MNALGSILIVLLSCSVSSRQVDRASTAPGTNCESASLLLESAISAARNDGSIKIVTHRGTLDHRADIVHRRIFNVATFLTDFYPDKRMPSERVRSSEGDTVQGQGTVEIFVNGQLVGTLVARPDRDILVGRCDDRDPVERKFYPWREQRR